MTSSSAARRHWSSSARRLLWQVGPAAALGLASLGAHAEAPRLNSVRFSATATQELVQDELTVTLEAVKEGAQAAEVQAELKRLLDAALTEARKQTQGVSPQALSVNTGGFHLYPRYGTNSRITGWQGSAQLVLTGNDAAKVSQVAGKLNQLNISNVSYGLSRTVREQNEAALTSQAIEQFKARAERIARDFGMKGYTLGELSVSSTDPVNEGRPVMMAMRAKASMAADAPLPVEPGKGVLTVTVSGDVILTP